MARPRSTTDDAVLDGTARALLRVGPSRMTLADVSDEVGLAPATLLQRFGSKRALVLAFATRRIDDLRNTFAGAEEASSSPLGALLNALTGLTSGIELPGELANHLAFLEMDLQDDDGRELATRYSEAMRSHIQSLLEAAVRDGELVRLQAPRVARAVQTTYYGSLLTWSRTGTGPLPEWLRFDLDLMLQPYKPLS